LLNLKINDPENASIPKDFKCSKIMVKFMKIFLRIKNNVDF